MINDESDEAWVWADKLPPPPPPPGAPLRPTAKMNPMPPRTLSQGNAMIPHPRRSFSLDRNPSDLVTSRSGIGSSLSDMADSTFVSTKSASTNSSSSRSRSIVDERRRVALVIYESEHSNSDESNAPLKEDEAVDPILMDRLSWGEIETDFSFSEPPWTESESTVSSEKAPPKPEKRNPLSPVSKWRNRFSPRNQLSPNFKESPKRQPVSPMSEFRNQISPKAELTPRMAAIDGEKELLRHRKSLFDTGSVATSVATSVDSRLNNNFASSPEAPSPRTRQLSVSTSAPPVPVPTSKVPPSPESNSKERLRQRRSLFDTASLATSVTTSVDSRMSNDFAPAPVAQSPPTRPLSVSTSAPPVPVLTLKVPVSPEADSLAYSAATTKAASISPSVLAVSPAMPSPEQSPYRSPRIRRKSTDDESKLASTTEKLPLDATPSEKGKRKTFFNKILGRRGKEKGALKSPEGSHDNPTTPVRSRRKSASSDKPTTAPKSSRRKKKSPEKIGRPQNVKPGQSYKSTPHSAEIVVRRSVEPKSSSDDTEALIRLPSREAPRDGPTVNDSRVSLSSNIDENAELNIDESFSSPRFANIEEASDTFSSSPKEQNFKHDSTFFHSHDDGVSVMTEPSCYGGSGEKRAGERAERRTKPLGKDNSVGSDPLGHYWDESEKKQVPSLKGNATIDPFACPFFETQATSSMSIDVTIPASNHSPSVDAIKEARSSSHENKSEDQVHTTQAEPQTEPEDAPDDEIPENQIQIADRLRKLAEREKMIVLANQISRMRVQKPVDSAPSTGSPVIGAKTLAYQSSHVRAEKSIDPAPLTGSPLIGARKLAHQSCPVRAQKSVDPAQLTRITMTPSQIVERRNEIAERRKRIEEKLNAVGITPVNTSMEEEDVEEKPSVLAQKSIDPGPLTGSPLIGARKLAHQSSPVRVKMSVGPAQLTGNSMTPSRIVERRNEIAERRKHIEEKLNAASITPVNTSMKNHDVEEMPLKSPGSRISGKAFAYLRTLKKERAPSTLSQQDNTTISGDKDPPPAVSKLSRSRDQQDVSCESPKNELATKSLLHRFQGRKPRAPSGSMQLPSPESSRAPNPIPAALEKLRKSRKSVRKPQNKMTMSSKMTAYEPKPLEVDIATVSRGIAIKRRNRQQLIVAGDVVVARRPPKRTASPEIHTISPELDLTRIKDPIKRAGLRVLSKSAIPIQSEIRRFLAQQKAVDRLWALTELQTYFRRWQCEAFLLAHIQSAIRIQAAVRGWQTRNTLSSEEHCITQIQAAVRGYLASLRAYDRLYHVVTLQAGARGMLARNKTRQAVGRVLLIQKCLRGFKARIEVATWHVAATIIQAEARCYLGQLHFSFDIVDIIIVQSVVRRWSVLRQAQRKRNLMLRKERQVQKQIQNRAACKIQAVWRGFHAYSMFIFVLADILVMQRTVRGWLAARQVKSIQQKGGATKIQAHWRGHKARVVMLYRLVHIIIVQSVVRRHLARKEALALRYWHAPALQATATKIQAAWRGFWQFSNYLVIRFELVRAQAAVRGHLVRRNARLRLGCIIILQATIRGYLDRQRFDQRNMIDFIIASKAIAMRERVASKRVQMFLTDAVQERKDMDRQRLDRMEMTDSIVASIATALRERNACKRVQMFLTDAVQKRKELDRQRFDRMKMSDSIVASIATALRERIACKRVQIFLTDAVQKRKDLDRQRLDQMKMTDSIVASTASALRERIACKRVQIFLTDAVQKRKAKEEALQKAEEEALQKAKEEALQKAEEEAAQKRKEKAAALKIEGFFLMVKEEVDREILRRQKKKSSRSSRRGKSEGDSSSWLNDGSSTLTLTDPGYNRSMARHRAQRPELKVPDARPTVAVRVNNADDVSVLTTPSVFKRQAAPSRSAYTRRELGRDPVLEESWIDEERNQQQMKEEYIQRHGFQERDSLRRHPHAPYGGPSPVDHRRVQSGRITTQFSEAFAPMPSHHEKHRWPSPSDHQYRPRPEQSTRPRRNAPRSSHTSRNLGMASEPHYHGHNSSGYGRESERPFGFHERPRGYQRYDEPRDHGSYSSEQQCQQRIQRVSSNAPQYHQQGAPRAPTRAPRYHQQGDARVSTSAPQYQETPRVSNPPRRLEIDDYEEFAYHTDVRKRMV